MSLESKSQELKDLIATYDTAWLLGDLSALMQNIGKGRAEDQLGGLSSPQRQLYYLGGLLISSKPTGERDIQYTPVKWNKIVGLLNNIEQEYEKMFFPESKESIDEEWLKIRKVAVPSFLSYFNQGPLNYEEQTINWVQELYTHLDHIIFKETGLTTQNFIDFYNNLDNLIQKNFQSIGSKGKIKMDWRKYVKVKLGNSFPPGFGMERDEDQELRYHYIADKGLILRFLPKELIFHNLSLEQVNNILSLLSSERKTSDFLYYTETKPGNPLYEQPIIKIDNELYQVFEVKQVIHAIEEILEKVCTKSQKDTTKLVKAKGKLLESKIEKLFKGFFGDKCEIITRYYVDGNEQDILVIWKDYVFIIEAKGYNLREPLRDPKKAFVRIKDDFKSSIGYAYEQTKRVEQKFINQIPLLITDSKGNTLKIIDTTKYQDFSIIVNINSFGQIQNDLSTLLDVNENEVFPWVIKLDDLETFLLTLKALKKSPKVFIDYLEMREGIHGNLICTDELEVCGAFIQDRINLRRVQNDELIVTSPDLAFIFDKQYDKGMGFENEKLLKEKQSGNYRFW